MKMGIALIVATGGVVFAANGQSIKFGNVEKANTDSKADKIIMTDAKGVYVAKL